MTESRIPNPRSHTSNGIIGHWSLVILLLCAVAVAPLLRSDSPCTHDGAFHYFRVAAMGHALRDSTEPLRAAFTRYLPDLAFGYGYPFFNYRAALSYYLALALHLAGLALPLALNLVYVLSIAGSALTAYLLARDLFGHRAGIVAAIAYAYAPYQFLDALLRANMPESVALPLFPLILWAFRRLALTGERRWFLASVGSLATLLLTHNISSLLFAPFLLAYLATLWLVYRQRGHWLAVGGAFALAFGLIAFFLGPALLEQGYAQLHMSRVTRNNDFHYNFLPLAEIFAPPAPVDTSLMNPPMRVHLGLVQAIAGGLGLLIGLIRWRDRERRATLVFLAITAIGLIWMSTRASLWLWEHIPLMPFIQFPWRLVGRAILPVSLLSGALISTPSPSTLHAPRTTHYALRITYYALVTILILSAFPYTSPPRDYCPNPSHPTIGDVFDYEHRSTLVGVDPEGSYFPIWVKRRPEGSPLEPQYAAGGPIARFDETILPTGATVVEANYGSNRARLLVEAPVSFQARYLVFYFPGWQVSIDGEPVDVTPTDPEGLVAFDVPAGRHTIVVRFGSTPTRTAFSAISILSLAILCALIPCYSRVANLQSRIPNLNLPESSSVIRHSSFVAHDMPLLIVAVLLLTFKLAVVDRTDTLFRRPALQPDGALPGVGHPLNQPYADGLMLVGYDQSQTTLPADGTLRVDLYWTTRARPTARYQTVIHLVDPDGLRWSMPDSFRPRGYAKYPPTNGWSPDGYALDSHEIESLPGTPPGTYDVVLTTFDRDTLAPLSLLNEQGQPAAPALTLGQVTLTAPRRPADPDALGMSHQTDAALGSLTLLGADLNRRAVAPGDAVLLTTFWRADQQPAQDLTIHLALLTQDGSPVAGYDLPPTTRRHPTSAWQPGDVWRGQHVLNIPADLDSGDYTWQLYVEPIHQSTHLSSTLHVSAPDRTFTPPLVDVEADIRLGTVATLLGANLKPFGLSLRTKPETFNLKPGNPLTVTLVWRAEDTPPASYHVFLHLLGPDGILVAQSDGVPAGWSRPTTGWTPGEYITDAHTLSIPPGAPEGEYTLSAGLYLPGGARLTTPDGADAIRLTTIQVDTP